jgi:phosphatidylinositol glycan class S
LPVFSTLTRHYMAAQPPKDPATVFHQNDYLRRSIIASYCLVVFLALPLWWNTTSIERLALPVHRVSLHAENDLRLPVYIHVEKHERELQNLLDISVPPNVDVKVTDNRDQGMLGFCLFFFFLGPAVSPLNCTF